MENELGLDIPLSGLVKDEKHRTSQLLYGNPLEIVPLQEIAKSFIYCNEFKMKFTALRLLFIANFAVKVPFSQCLDDIPGIGEKRKKLLLKHFGSVKKMKEATIEEFTELGYSKKCSRRIYE